MNIIKTHSQSHIESLRSLTIRHTYHFVCVQILLLKSASYCITKDIAHITNVFDLLTMDDPSLIDWLFDKNNPPDNEDNPPNAKMSSIHFDPKTRSFVPTTLKYKPPFHSTTIWTKNNNLIIEKAMSQTLVDWGFDNDNPPENVSVFSLHYDKTEN